MRVLGNRVYSLEKALEAMRRSGVRRLPVVDDSGELAGIRAAAIAARTRHNCMWMLGHYGP